MGMCLDKCENCGKEKVDNDQNFCSRCGQKFKRIGNCPVCYETRELHILSCGHTVCDKVCRHHCHEKCPICRRIFVNDSTCIREISVCNHCYSSKIEYKKNGYSCQNCEKNIDVEKLILINMSQYNTGSYTVKLQKDINPHYNYYCNNCCNLDSWNLESSKKCKRCRITINPKNIKLFDVIDKLIVL